MKLFANFICYCVSNLSIINVFQISRECFNSKATSNQGNWFSKESRIQIEEVFRPIGKFFTPGYIMVKNWTLHFVTHATKYWYHLGETMILLQKDFKIGKKHYIVKKMNVVNLKNISTFKVIRQKFYASSRYHEKNTTKFLKCITRI